MHFHPSSHRDTFHNPFNPGAWDPIPYPFILHGVVYTPYIPDPPPYHYKTNTNTETGKNPKPSQPQQKPKRRPSVRRASHSFWRGMRRDRQNYFPKCEEYDFSQDASRGGTGERERRRERPTFEASEEEVQVTDVEDETVAVGDGEGDVLVGRPKRRKSSLRDGILRMLRRRRGSKDNEEKE